MTVYYSGYSNPNTSGTLGTSLVDLTSASFADLVANAAAYSSVVQYKKGTIVYDQNSSWVYINNTPSSNNPPPTLPTISNAYWELLGTNGTFTWIVYANSTNGTTFTDFTTGAYDTGGIIRKWIGISPNKTTGVESTNTADYAWSKFIGDDGAAGSTSATISIYRRSASAPTLPSAATTYTFSTSTLTGLNNGWTTSVPSGSDPLYVSSATAFNSGATDTIQANEWSSPVILAQNGTDGTNGLSVATVFLYQRTATTTPPTVATSGSATYTFSSGAITGQPSGWTSAVPSSGGGYLWAIQATASNTTATDAIANTEWSSPVLISQDGAAGANGARTAVLEMYQWANSAPSSFPSGTSTYTWSTGAFTAPATANSWTLTPGTPSPGQTLYVVRQVYSDSLTSATSTVTWSATSSLPSGAAGTNGSNGANGQRVGVLEVYLWSATSPTTYPSGTSTYTWATGVYTPPSTANGWTLVPGAAVVGQTLWGISVSVSDNLTTSTSTATWNSTTPYAVGYAGTNGVNGVNGERGSKEFFATGSSWSDATANAAITATGLTRVLLDQVTISNGTNFAETRFWNGTAWTTISQVINGNLLVNGTVGANALVAGTVLANVFNVGDTKFKLDGAAKGAGKGALIVTNGSNDILTVGYLDASNIGLSLKDTSGNIVMQTSTPAGGGTTANSFAPAISNSAITVDLNGNIQNIGTGSGTTVANNQIAVNGSGQLTGIGTGANTTVANNQIAISGGAISGIGTGTGTMIANNAITIDANGILQGTGTANTVVANNQITVSGGQISGIGTGSGTYVVSNLQDSSTWKPGSTPPWGLNGNANENSIVWGVGPKGGNIPLWKCTSSGDGEADGGWNNPTSFRVDVNKTYRFMVPFRNETITGTSGSAYLGIDGNAVCNLNTTTQNNNPYFHAIARTNFVINRWYLMVGFVYPAGTTGATNDGAHIYDMTTGAIVANGANYTWHSGTAVCGTRAYQYYATTAGNIQYFAPPVVEVVNGQESSINELLQASAIFNQSIAINGSGQITGIGTGANTTVANNQITVSGGAISGIGTGTGTMIANNAITIDASGILQGTGTANTVVANNQIAINGSGQLTGIGTGVNTTVANSQITVSGGAISGIGTGTGTMVANSAITVDGSGILQGAGTANVVIANNQIAVNASGQLTGIGTGANTTVANNQIAINGSGQLTGIGTGVNTTVANNQITISSGTINGIGTGSGTAVDNNFTLIGQNILPNSDCAQNQSWLVQYNPNGATLTTPALAKSAGYGWTTSNYVLAGTETNNLVIYQTGIATGTVDGSGNNAVACDIYPFEAGNMVAMPALPGEQFIASVYIGNHRCTSSVFIGFYNSAGTALSYHESAQVGPTEANTNILSLYNRAFVKGTAPANTALVRLFVRKRNTLAGNSDSWMWWAAPQLERVNSGVTLPSPYQPGPVSSTRQLGYSGDLNATLGAVAGTNLRRSNNAILNDGDVITSQGTAAAISGQGALATLNSADFSTQVSGSNKPEALATNDRFVDRRSTNELPSWYFSNFPMRTVNEFKESPALGVPGNGGGIYGALVTFVDWTDISGGQVKQTFTYGTGSLAGVSYVRTSNGSSAWGTWTKDYSGFLRPTFDANDLLETGSTVATVANFKTSQGTAAAIANQAATATSSDFSVITGATKPANNANNTFVDGSGNIQGVSSGGGTTVANNQIAVNGSGQLTGIGTGVNTTVANNQISVSGGAINGIGTGTGTMVANSSITIDGSGILQGVGTANIPVANSQVPVGQNLAINTDFINGTVGWTPAWDGNIGGTITRGLNLSGWSGQLNVLFATRSGTPTAGTVFDAYVTDITDGTVEGLKRYATPVIPGERVYFSWLVAGHRCSTRATIGWYNSSGGYVSEDAGTDFAENYGASNGDPSTMARSGAFVTVPANARYARIWVRATATGAADPYVFCAQPYITKVSASQTAVPAYSSGPADRAATLGAVAGTNLRRSNNVVLNDGDVVTSLGTAASIANQAATATSSDFSVITGATKPANNATVGATIGTNLSGQFTSGNVPTFFANASIGAAQIGSIQLVGTNNFSVKSSASGARMELDSQVIKIYDANNVLRVQLGIW